VKHIKRGDTTLHVADEVADAMENLGQALNRSSMGASLTIPTVGEGGVITLRLLSASDREAGEQPAEGFVNWQVLLPHVSRARANPSGQTSHFGIDDIE
jgi:hypothetical protein